jgi:hypothetical protein
MKFLTSRLMLLAVVGSCAAGNAWCDDADALSLKSDEASEKPAADKPLRIAVEAALGQITPPGNASRRDGRRLSVDLRYAATLTNAWRFRLSDRVDHVIPVTGAGETVNSLREALLSWQSEDGSESIEVGRVNVRQGPGLSYSPTDYFRTGGLRSVISADPVALREMRLGTFMLRYNRLWDGGGLSVAVAPRLQDESAAGPWDLDAGATNHVHRAMLSVNAKGSDKVSGQATLLLERGQSARIGASASALATDALVVYGEWSTGKLRSVLETLTGAPAKRRQQAVLGLTYTLPGALAITVESAYNGAGLGRAGWNALSAQGPAAFQGYLGTVQRDQELADRGTLLVYASKSGLAGVKQLELKGFVRANRADRSRLAWAEVRYHWPRFDAALQWQRVSGTGSSEFGALPVRQLVQVIGAAYW